MRAVILAIIVACACAGKAPEKKLGFSSFHRGFLTAYVAPFR